MVTAKKYDSHVLESFASRIIEVPDFANDYLNSNENTAGWIEETFAKHFENKSTPDIVLIGGWPFFASIPFFRRNGLKVIFMDCGAVPLDGFTGGALAVQEKLRGLRKRFLPETSLVIGISDYIVQSQSKIDTNGDVPVQTILLGADHLDLPVWGSKELLLEESPGYATDIVDSLRSQGKKLILSLGRWEPHCYKNSEAMFDIMRQIRDGAPECTLLILADPHAVEIPPDLQRSIIPIGFPDDSELKKVMTLVDLGISPSLWEGFNLPIVEMQWSGRPVLAFHIGAHPEVILDPWYLCTDNTDMVVKAGEILNGHDIEVSRRELLFERFRTLFRWNRTIEEYDEVIRDLMADGAGREAKSLTIIVDVTNAVRDPANSGVIRVTRRMCKELQGYLDPVFVVWDPESDCYILPKRSEFRQLAEFNGPLLKDESRLSPDDQSITLDEYLPLPGGTSWLLFTETVAETSARTARRYARNKGIRLAALFYDAIPVLCPDFCTDPVTRTNHRHYMTGISECDVVIPISYYSSQCLREFWKDNTIEGCDVMPNLLPGEFGGAPRTRKIPEFETKSIDILCVSTLEPRKNHKKLIQACLLLQEKYPDLDWNLTLVGNRYAGAFDIAEYIQSISLDNPRINWQGVVDDATLHTLYERSSFTVYPSVIEGFGMPILESLWHGKPCICYNKGVMAELAGDGGCLTTDVTDENALSDTIYRLSTDKELFLKLSRYAVTRKIKSWDDYILELLSILVSKSANTCPSLSYPESVAPIGPQNWEDILYPDCLCEHWQMNHSERLALTALLSRHKPRCSIEVGTYMGGSLSLISQYSHTVFSIDIDPTIPERFGKFKNVGFFTGPSQIVLPLLLKELDREQIPVDFLLIDGDHSAEGIKQDIESVLSYVPKKPLFVVMHDSFNPECRRGMLDVRWEKSPYVHWVDLDFIPGRIVEAEGPSQGEMWGGLALAYLKPVIRHGSLQVNLSANRTHEILRKCRK
ncbi:MAG: glycosyltransferase [Methanofollis sp.]|uniref:glycosyltransferase n=1 Tax=Methanofollis sp. TaxID=2052835 RepID=UPI00262E8C2A|nr:glycosyltransferase [Methanofollis sp.]MDD4254486.1 glycosyltransferase [Methanofollis sp.]